MKKLKIVVFLICITLLCALLLTSCSQKITEGEVYEKEFKEAHTEVRIIPIVMTNGETTHTIMMPFTYSYPDRYIVYIKKFEDNEWKTANYYVTKEIYENIKIGDEFEYVEGRDLVDEPYTRERSE